MTDETSMNGPEVGGENAAPTATAHYAELFVQDGFLPGHGGSWGFQCFTCGAEEMGEAREHVEQLLREHLDSPGGTP